MCQNQESRKAKKEKALMNLMNQNRVKENVLKVTPKPIQAIVSEPDHLVK